MADEPSTIPPGWDYNPSSWPLRLAVFGLALAGLGISIAMTLYQYEVIPRIWEPFFDHGSQVILKSWISFAPPISDAALGAIGFFTEAALAVVGSRARWRTMPWVAVLFGMTVGGLGFGSIFLLVLQPVMFDFWCTLCITTAVISVAMIGPALTELLASLQHVRRQKALGRTWWRVLLGLDGTARRPEAAFARTEDAGEAA